MSMNKKMFFDYIKSLSYPNGVEFEIGEDFENNSILIKCLKCSETGLVWFHVIDWKQLSMMKLDWPLMHREFLIEHAKEHNKLVESLSEQCIAYKEVIEYLHKEIRKHQKVIENLHEELKIKKHSELENLKKQPLPISKQKLNGIRLIECND